MRAIELSPGHAELLEAPKPTLLEGHTLLRVLACGICGTDAHLYSGMKLPRGASYPLRPGHEVVGEVVAVSDPSSSLSLGDRAVLHIFDVCGTCRACRSGNEELCTNARILGIHAPGGMADLVSWPTARLVPVSAKLGQAASLLPDAVATAYHALQMLDISGEAPVCVIGAGGVGSNVLELAKIEYPNVPRAAIVRSERTANKIAGLADFIVLGLEGSAKAVKAELGRCQAVVDFSGTGDAAPEAVRMLEPGGQLILGSVSSDPFDPKIAITGIVSRETRISGSYGSTIDDLRTVCKLAESGSLELERSIGDVVPLELVPSIFREGSNASGRIVVVPGSQG